MTVRPGPPRPPLVLCAGVTGHRADALDPGSTAMLAERIGETLEQLRSACAALCTDTVLFADDAPCLRLVSPLGVPGYQRAV